MELEELLAREQIRTLSGTYMRGLDRLDMEALRSVFFDDAEMDYGFFKGGPDDFVAMCHGALKDHLANQHLVGQINIELHGNTAFGEVYFQAFHRVIEEGEERDLIIAGRYVDRYECRNSEWKISFRSEVNDWSTNVPASDSYFERAPTSLRGARKPEDGLYSVPDRENFVMEDK